MEKEHFCFLGFCIKTWHDLLHLPFSGASCCCCYDEGLNLHFLFIFFSQAVTALVKNFPKPMVFSMQQILPIVWNTLTESAALYPSRCCLWCNWLCWVNHLLCQQDQKALVYSGTCVLWGWGKKKKKIILKQNISNKLHSFSVSPQPTVFFLKPVVHLRENWSKLHRRSGWSCGLGWWAEFYIFILPQHVGSKSLNFVPLFKLVHAWFYF